MSGRVFGTAPAIESVGDLSTERRNNFNPAKRNETFGTPPGCMEVKASLRNSEEPKKF